MERPAFVLTGDLFFRVKIETVASATGAALTAVESVSALPDRGLDDALVLVDLGYRSGRPLEAIAKLKSRPDAPTVVAFGSHQDREGLKGARDGGADRVVARSTFVEILPQLLAREGLDER